MTTPIDPTLMNCHQCTATVAPTDKFCEECGVNLVSKSVSQQMGNSCQKCGAAADQIDVDRYCTGCGFRQVAIEHETILLELAPNFAGASDRGRRHHQNEDAIALKIIDEGVYTIVICDGVSISQHPELASRFAATACVEGIETSLQQTANAETAICNGVNKALQAVSSIPFEPNNSIADPSSATIVTAIVRDNLATIGWLGDSRAYWLAADKSLQLTQDDSWARENVAAGNMTMEEAEKSPHAHAITRWLGSDLDDDGVPSLVSFPIPGAGYLLLCTDGLWNYAPEPSYLYHLIQQSPSKNGIDIARHLVQYANQQGGQDNITVSVLVF
jgi:PPM family protein phosphatase